MTSVRRAGHSNWVIGAIAALAIFGLTASVSVAIKESNDASASSQRQAVATAEQARDISCIKQWVAKTNQRDATVGHYATIRSRALGRVQLFQARHPTSNGPHLANLRLAYVVADQAYLSAERRYPTPKFTCADLPPLRFPPFRTPRPVYVSSPPATAKPPPRTRAAPAPPKVTVTTTSTVPGPPGKGRTVTATPAPRTVTVSLTPTCILLPCLQLP